MRHHVFYGSEGNRLESDIYGSGEKIALLLHGGGQTRYAWKATAKALADNGYTAIALDQRGHGTSQWVQSQRYSFADYRNDALAVAMQIQAQFKGKPALIGASLGGIAGLYAEGKAKLDGYSLFSSLIMVDISPYMEAKGIANVQGFMREQMHNGFGSIDEVVAAVSQYLPGRKKPPSSEGLMKNLRLCDDGRLRWHWDPAFMEGAHTINEHRETLLAALEEASRALTIPTLLVRGGSSDIILEEQAQKFIALVPHAKYVDVAGAGHMVAGDKNDAFTSAVMGFMS